MGATVMLNAASLARPHLLKILTDEVLTGNHLEDRMPLLGKILAGLLAAVVVKSLFTYIQGVSLNQASQGTIRDMREDVFSHMQKLPLSWFEGNRIGDTLIRFTDDLRVSVEFLTSGVTLATNDSLTFVTSLAWMLHKDWQLTVIATVVMPLAGITVRRYAKKLSEATTTAQEKLADLSSVVQETVSGIKVVKSFNREEQEGDRFSAHNEESFRWAMRIVQHTATQSPIVEVLATSGIALVLWYCALNVIAGRLTLGDLLAFWAYMLMATTPVNRMPQVSSLTQRGLTALDRFLSIRDEATEAEAAAAARARAGRPQAAEIELDQVRGDIELRNVRFRYSADRDEALRGVSLTIRAGEHVALLGRNGAGKSTLVNLLPRFHEVQDGEILIDGVNTLDIALPSLRRHIGLVAQDTFLFSGTLASNLRYGKESATDAELAEALRGSGADSFVNRLEGGLAFTLGERGSGLSGGQRQRIAIARMLIKDPRIVILDEATSNLDPEAEQAVRDSLAAITRGRTVITIAHRLAAARGADRIIVLDQGTVAEQGTHAELMASGGLYCDMWTQMRQDAEGGAA